jgi:uncharacterized SAM-binding protein YcdF (DUF218 family)
MHEFIDQDVGILWNYMQMHQAAGEADCLLVLGGRDDRVASYAAELAQKFHYWYVVVTGGIAAHNEIAKLWDEPTEAEHFAAIMKREGYLKPIMLEKEAKNTGENAANTFKMLQTLDTPMPLTIQLVTKTYMERRAIATFEAQWPDKDASFKVSSPQISYEESLDDTHTRDQTINVMVGDMHRILEYPKSGYQSHQHVPDEVHAAYTRLVAAGFTKRLLDI